MAQETPIPSLLGRTLEVEAGLLETLEAARRSLDDWRDDEPVALSAGVQRTILDVALLLMEEQMARYEVQR